MNPWEGIEAQAQNGIQLAQSPKEYPTMSVAYTLPKEPAPLQKEPSPLTPPDQLQANPMGYSQDDQPQPGADMPPVSYNPWNLV